MEYKHLTNTKKVGKIIHTFVKWKAPKIGYKLNTNGLTSKKNNGIGGVIRNNKGDWILGFIGNSYQQDTITTEMYPLRTGLSLTLKHKLQSLEISTDCKEIIHMLTQNHCITP